MKCLVAMVGVVIVLVSHDAMADRSNWVVVEIGHVQVARTKPDNTPWDSPREADPMCGPLSTLATSLGHPIVGATVTILCGMNDRATGKRDPAAPDLVAAVVADSTSYITPVWTNTYDAYFDYRVLIPLDAVPSSGLKIEVFDDDPDGAQPIGRVVLLRSFLEDNIGEGPKVLGRADSIESMEVTIDPYAPTSASARQVSFQANSEPVEAFPAVIAGERVALVAQGQYSIVDSGELIDETGYAVDPHVFRDWRRNEFRSSKLGAAIAFIGPPAASHMPVAIGNCITAVASMSGKVYVGVNDRDVGNNRGVVTFAMATAAPTLDQWRRGGVFTCSAQSGGN